MADLAVRRGATPMFVEGDVEMSFPYALEVDRRHDVVHAAARGALRRAATAPDCGCSGPSTAGFGGVALFALGYEDEATWNAVDAVSPPSSSRSHRGDAGARPAHAGELIEPG